MNVYACVYNNNIVIIKYMYIYIYIDIYNIDIDPKPLRRGGNMQHNIV